MTMDKSFSDRAALSLLHYLRYYPDGNFPIVNGEKGILTFETSYPQVTPQDVTPALIAVCISTPESPT